MEKKITKLFDELTPEEAALAGDECRIEHGNKDISARILSLTKRKAGITMTETTNTQKKRRRIKRTTFIAIAAAAVLSCTAAAAGLIAVHEKSVNKYFGEGAAAELAKKGIMINKVDTNDDYELTVDLAYATEDYARVMFTFEGRTDEAKQRIANTTNWYWDINADYDYSKQLGLGYGGGFMGDYDESIDERKNGIYTFDVTIDVENGTFDDIDSFTLSMIPEEWSDANGVENPDGELNLITVDFELKQNITPTYFKSENGNADLWVCDYEIKIPDNVDNETNKNKIVPYLWYSPEDEFFNEDNPEGETKESHNAYYNAHKDDILMTVYYNDGTKASFTSNDIRVSGDNVYFWGTSIDTENIEKIVMGDGKYTYTRAE
ncbi:MAG: hypothetical protein K6F91_06965 [Ruminococcus sp.]|nr:hypothetical protein [Ruminococcus sp.]